VEDRVRDRRVPGLPVRRRSFDDEYQICDKALIAI